MEHLMDILPWAMIIQTWKDSDFGRQGIGRITCEDVLIISGECAFTVFGSMLTYSWFLSALYVIDLVRFRQLAAGVSSSFKVPRRDSLGLPSIDALI
jgi:hypothetical protein